MSETTTTSSDSPARLRPPGTKALLYAVLAPVGGLAVGIVAGIITVPGHSASVYTGPMGLILYGLLVGVIGTIVGVVIGIIQRLLGGPPGRIAFGQCSLRRSSRRSCGPSSSLC